MDIREKLQAYSRGFAGAYNVQWSAFASNLAPKLADFLDPRMVGPDKRLLDVCCGTGRLATGFLERGYKVVGVDLSPSMIEFAKDNNRAAVERGDAEFLVANAACFDVERRFPFATSTFDALNHLPDLATLGDCFKCVAEALLPGGIFVFDLNTEKALGNWNDIHVIDEEDIAIVNRQFFAPGDERAVISITGFLRNDSGTFDRFTERIYEVAFHSRDVFRLLAEAGFSDSYASSGRDLSVPVENPEALERAFYVCRKG